MHGEILHATFETLSMLASRVSTCWLWESLHAGIEIYYMLALRFFPCMHELQSACCFRGISLLTWGDMPCNSGWIAEKR